MTRRAARVDGNHTAIKQNLERLGCEVEDTSGVGGGFPDLIVGKRGRAVFLEIKDPSQPPSGRRLTPAQEKWHARWKAQGVPVFVVETFEEAVDAVFERQREQEKR